MNLLQEPKYMLLYIAIAMVIGVPVLFAVRYLGMKYNFYIGTIHISLVVIAITYVIMYKIIKKKSDM